jgi:hypothetical protein
MNDFQTKEELGGLGKLDRYGSMGETPCMITKTVLSYDEEVNSCFCPCTIFTILLPFHRSRVVGAVSSLKSLSFTNARASDCATKMIWCNMSEQNGTYPN